MAKVQIKGPIVSGDIKWIYEWFGIEATSPKDVEKALIEANGEDLEVEINSGGGDVYAGSEIYTALKAYAGNVIVKIVGIAASAAGVIAMSGKKVMISPTAQFMMHNVSSGASGDYRAMEHRAEVLKNYNISIANSYMLKTGMEQEKLLDLMNKETWLNAQQAVEYGFADEVMFDENNQLVASLNSTLVLPPEVINKMRNFLKNPSGQFEDKQIPSFGFVPGKQQSLLAVSGDDSFEVPIPSHKVGGLINQTKEDAKLEIKNVEELRKAFPDLVAQAETTAREAGKAEGVIDGAKAERERIQAIDEISKIINPELVNKAKYTEPMTAEQLAFNSLRADSGKGRQYMEDLIKDNDDSGAKNLGANPQDQRTKDEKKQAEQAAAVDDIAAFANKRRAK